MADKRAYAKFDVGYLDNPKVGPLLEDDRPYAVILHAASILYSAQHLTDGGVRVKTLLRKYGGDQDDVNALIAAGLWIDLGDGTIQIHDYLEHNRSAAQVKKAQEAGAKGAASRWARPDADPTDPDDADRNANRIGGADANPNAQRERKREREVDGPRKRGTRLPDDWTPSPELRRWTLEECPGLNGPQIAAQFRDYWHGVPGSKGVKLDWDATWRNWCRREHEGGTR